MKKKFFIAAFLLLGFSIANIPNTSAQTATTPPQHAPQLHNSAGHKESIRDEIRAEIRSFYEKMKQLNLEFKQKSEALRNALSPEAKKVMEAKHRNSSMKKGKERDKEAPLVNKE